MSTEYRVPVTKIVAINPHPNADRLSIATVFDFNVVVRKDQYLVGSSVVYIPIDSLLPSNLESQIFGPDSKIKLNGGRVKQIRIRQFPSQGMLLSIDDVKSVHPNIGELEEGQNLAEALGITKFEPPAPDYQANSPRVKKERNKVWENPYFHEYGGLENIKYYPDMFVEGQEVVYQAKIHGTNGRAGVLPRVPKTIWDKCLNFVGLFPKYQFTYGSNTVQLQNKTFSGFYDTNVYAEAVINYDLEAKIQPNETVYFEIYGQSIQKNYMYDCAPGERKIFVFDVKILADDKKSTRWLTVDELTAWCAERGLPLVPQLYRGPHSKELAQQYTKGTCVGGQAVREGVVIRDPNETVSYYGKKFLKLLSEEYLDLKDNSDFH